MRIAVLCVFLTSLAAFVAAGESEDGRMGLFSRSEEAPLEVSTRVLFTEGRTRYGSSGGSDRFDTDNNIMGVLDVQFHLPRIPWVGLHGRFGTTLSDSGGELNGTDDCDVDLTLIEVNATFTLAGISSPLTPDHGLPRSKLEAFAGVRSFKEEFDSDNGFDYEARWIGLQAGLRGTWALYDTYDKSDATRGWSLSARLVILPWIDFKGEGKLGGSKVFEQESSSGYGVAASVGVNYRLRSWAFGAGYGFQHLQVDDGEHDQTGVGDDLSHVKSRRRGFFLQAALHF